ncbi:homocysteine S-methyltransferase [Halobacillus campisalis]|uniref:Homocysteine S-methyltransferase n=1 Tax=Halobacillus campisalis TaxID=435909 RepID=A0ABW2K485_9BACI|nr:homocysteine S-methyltransferase [Halobacillus campisalis]
MNPIDNILKEQTLVVLDGALASELEAIGCDLNDDLWSAKIMLEQPESIKQLHLKYFKAGADVAITASYQASVEGFMNRGLTERESIELIKKSVYLAAEARDEFWEEDGNRLNRSKPLVAASVGPYGAFLADGSEYSGNYTINEEALKDFHRPRMKALVEAGADVIACETLPSFSEAKVLVSLLEEFPQVYAWMSFSAKDHFHISEGHNMADCAKWLDSCSQIAAIGVNCTKPQYISSLVQQISENTSKPILIYPNSGEEYVAQTNSWKGEADDLSIGAYTEKWFETGARLIGGCCRTTPNDIQIMAGYKHRMCQGE